MWFSPNSSSKTLVLSDAKTLQEFEKHLPAKQFPTVTLTLLFAKTALCNRRRNYYKNDVIP